MFRRFGHQRRLRVLHGRQLGSGRRDCRDSVRRQSPDLPLRSPSQCRLPRDGAAQAFDSTRSRARRLIRSLREERDAAAEVRDELRMVRGERDVLTSRVAVLQDELDDRDEAIDQLKNEHQATASELAALREDQASLDSMCLELRDQVQQLAETMEELASAKAEWEAERQQLSLELEAGPARTGPTRGDAASDPTPQPEIASDDSDQFALAPAAAEGREVTECVTTEPEELKTQLSNCRSVRNSPLPVGSSRHQMVSRIRLNRRTRVTTRPLPFRLSKWPMSPSLRVARRVPVVSVPTPHRWRTCGTSNVLKWRPAKRRCCPKSLAHSRSLPRGRKKSLRRFLPTAAPPLQPPPGGSITSRMTSQKTPWNRRRCASRVDRRGFSRGTHSYRTDCRVSAG